MRFLRVPVLAAWIVLSVRLYLYLRRMGLDPKGTTIPQSISFAFVQRNMFRIADAEREEFNCLQPNVIPWMT